MSKTIGALWKAKESETGPVAYGQIELIAGFPQKVSVFLNKKKTKDNHPDMNIVLNEFNKNSEKEKDKPNKSFP